MSGGLIDPLWVSSPFLVARELWELTISGELLADVWMTVSEALIAFVVSSVLGIVSGLLLARSPFWDDVLAPIIVALNSLPRIALAPLIILWFGVGVVAKVVTAFTLVYFILLVNTLGGAKNVDNDIMTIAQLMGASKRDLLWKVVLPSSLPWIFAGLSIALTYSLLGVIVAEILASNQGLGLSDRQQRRQFRHGRRVRGARRAGRDRLAVQYRDAQDRGTAAALETIADQRLKPGTKDSTVAEPKIRLVQVGITFRPREREPVEAVRNISLDVPDGSIVTVVGPSGCGKSTILNAVSGLLTPTRGHAEIDGKRVEGVRHDVGYMFARDGMMPWRTALGNVEFGLEIRGVANRREIARDWLRRVGLEKFEGHYRHELSQGMRQRVAVARTFAIDPDVLLMDEPFGALDSQTRLLLQELFLSVWESTRKTVLFVTHDLHEAIFLSDVVIVFTNRPGRVKSVIPIDLPRPRLPPAELATATEFRDIYARIWQRSARRGARVRIARPPSADPAGRAYSR